MEGECECESECEDESKGAEGHSMVLEGECSSQGSSQGWPIQIGRVQQ